MSLKRYKSLFQHTTVIGTLLLMTPSCAWLTPAQKRIDKNKDQISSSFQKELHRQQNLKNHADTYIQPPEDIDLIGSIQYVKAHENETLLDIARNNDIGQDEIVIANPDVDRWLAKK